MSPLLKNGCELCIAFTGRSPALRGMGCSSCHAHPKCLWSSLCASLLNDPPPPPQSPLTTSERYWRPGISSARRYPETTLLKPLRHLYMYHFIYMKDFLFKKIRFCRVLRIPVFCMWIQTFDKSYYRNQNAVFWWNAARGCYASWTNFNSSFMHYLTQNAMMDIPLISECILMLIHNFNLYQHVSEQANRGLLRELSYFPQFRM